jgi:D-alanine-D-alanine ligase
MLIGLTYDLRQDYLDAGHGEEETAEFDRSDTIDAIESTLRELGHEPDRIGRVTSLVERLARGDRWDLVFNIAEGLHGIGREAQVPALLDAYEIPYTYSDPMVCALALHKPMTKRVVRDLGLPTPDFWVVETEADAEKVIEAHRPSESTPLFAKPMAEGTSKGVTTASKAVSDMQLRDVCRRLLKKFNQPVLVEEYLPGREFTVGIVGTGDDAEVVAVMEVTLLPSAEAEVYTYLNKEECEERVKYVLIPPVSAMAIEASNLALATWRGIGCRDGGRVDVRADASGQLSFIEVNPLPGIHPRHSDLPIMAGLAGWTYRQLIERIVASACRRISACACGLARAAK